MKEYKTIDIGRHFILDKDSQDSPLQPLEELLNEFGSLGWEYHSIVEVFTGNTKGMLNRVDKDSIQKRYAVIFQREI